MYGVAYSRCGHHQDAEDVVQDAAIVLLKQETTSGDERAIAWTATDYALKDRWQRESAKARGGTGQARPDRQTDERVSTRSLDGVRVGSLPVVASAERTALARMELAALLETAPLEARLAAAGYTLREIGEATSTPPQTVYSRVTKWRALNCES